ncbi:MAG: site-specific integrase [Aestuariibacter sp.]
MHKRILTMSRSPFLNSISDYMFSRGYSKRTISTYICWIVKFIRFHNNRHPSSMGDGEVEKFLEHLAISQKVAMRVSVRSNTPAS